MKRLDVTSNARPSQVNPDAESIFCESRDRPFPRPSSGNCEIYIDDRRRVQCPWRGSTWPSGSSRTRGFWSRETCAWTYLIIIFFYYQLLIFFLLNIIKIIALFIAKSFWPGVSWGLRLLKFRCDLRRRGLRARTYIVSRSPEIRFNRNTRPCSRDLAKNCLIWNLNKWQLRKKQRNVINLCLIRPTAQLATVENEKSGGGAIWCTITMCWC